MPSLRPLPAQPAGVPWPTEQWPVRRLEDPERKALEGVAARLFGGGRGASYGETFALLLVQGGELVFERYGDGIGADDTQRSWSMAKSMTHALAGLLIADGSLAVDDLAPVGDWRDAGDLRSQIRIEHLLRMTDGLDFVEDFTPGVHNDVIDMIYQSGKRDTAAYARARQGIHPPGTHWHYSSGTTNILAAILGSLVPGGGEGMPRYPSERLFEPIGMTSARPRFDAAGTFIGSACVFATARDFLRFGLLYLRDGVWQGERLLPEGWVDHARSVTPASDGQYGAHWWVDRVGTGTFAAVG